MKTAIPSRKRSQAIVRLIEKEIERREKAHRIALFLNGQALQKKVLVSKSGIYELISSSEGHGVLEVKVLDPGLAFYTFTFG